MDSQNIYKLVIDAALLCFENAAHLPDGVSQVPSDLIEAFGDAISVLVEAEERAGMTKFDYLANPLEPALKACDELYLAFFDKVIIPGERYLFSNANDEGVRYICAPDLLKFAETMSQYKEVIAKHVGG